MATLTARLGVEPAKGGKRFLILSVDLCAGGVDEDRRIWAGGVRWVLQLLEF